MALFNESQPGGLWHPVRHKALSYTWARANGLGAAMLHTAEAGSIRTHTLLHHAPLVMARPKPENAAYMSAGMAGGGIMDVLKTALSYGKSFLKGVIPYSIRGSSFGTPGSYMTTG